MARARTKRKQTSVSLSDESLKRLDNICKAESRNRSNAIEWLIAKAGKEITA